MAGAIGAASSGGTGASTGAISRGSMLEKGKMRLVVEFLGWLLLTDFDKN